MSELADSGLQVDSANVTFVFMLTPSQALDQFIGDLTRKSRSKSGRTPDSYRRTLAKFVEQLEAGGGRKVDVSKITATFCPGV